jgi:Fe-S cluster assembly protein SufD
MTARSDASLAGMDRLPDRAWAAALRAQATNVLLTGGIPGHRDEEWKHTNTAVLREASYVAAPPYAGALPAAAEAAFATQAIARLVLLNGILAPAHSDLAGLPPRAWAGSLVSDPWNERSLAQGQLGRLADVMHSHVAARNSSMMQDAVLLYLPPGTRLERPVQLVCVDGPHGGASSPRVLIIAGEGAEATILETHAGGARGGISLPVTEILLRSGAALRHYVVVSPGAGAAHAGGVHVELGQGSRFVSHTLACGAALARRELEVYLTGPGAACSLHGLSMASGDEHVEIRTLVRHAAGRCVSEQRFRGVFGGHAHGSFHGKVAVSSDAQKTEASQHSANLLLSEHAVVHARPQLEIFADDVRCAHGATVGQLDEEAEFYLRSRGLDREEARALLTRGFAHEVISSTGSEWYERQAGSRLGQMLGELPGRQA